MLGCLQERGGGTGGERSQPASQKQAQRQPLAPFANAISRSAPKPAARNPDRNSTHSHPLQPLWTLQAHRLVCSFAELYLLVFFTLNKW